MTRDLRAGLVPRLPAAATPPPAEPQLVLWCNTLYSYCIDIRVTSTKYCTFIDAIALYIRYDPRIRRLHTQIS